MAQMVECLLQTTTLAPAAREEGSCLHSTGELGMEGRGTPHHHVSPQKNAKIIKKKRKRRSCSQGAAEIHCFLNKTDFHGELISPGSGNVTCLALGFCCLPSQFGGWVVTDRNLSREPSH